MKGEKGQSVVEFALALPLFLVFFMGFMAFGLILSDYLALQHYARAVARDATVVSDSANGYTYSSVRESYVSATNDANGNLLPNSLFVWDPSTEEGLSFSPKGGGEVIAVKLTAKANNDASGLIRTFNNILNISSVLQSMTVEYHLYNEASLE